MSRKKDETGNVYKHLTVLGIAHKKYGRYFWLCDCDCGKQSVVDGNHLRMGHTTSCGCRKNTRHGYSYTSEYQSWLDMKGRCHNPNNPSFQNYGGRGISVCEQWNKFAAFISDMGDKPTPQRSIERIDNDGNYEPSNCKWATQSEQMRNRRANRIIEYNGESRCLTEWAELLNLRPSTLTARLNRGWSLDRALSPSPPIVQTVQVHGTNQHAQ